VAEDSEQLSRYRRARQDFFARHGARWPATLADEFDLLAPLNLKRSEADEILNAAGNLGRIYQRAAQLLRQFSDEALLELGVPNHLLRFVRCVIPGIADCVVGRFDLVRTENGYKLLEFNTDTPGLMVEAFSVGPEVCCDAGMGDPNPEGEQILTQALSDAVRAGIAYVGEENCEGANVVVTSASHFIRDVAMAEYLCRLLASLSARYAPIASLSIDAEGLYDPEGRRIDVLYRVFPLQFIGNEIFQPRGITRDPKMGGMLQRLVERGRLAIINPPFSFLLESKALQAVIWNMADSELYFTADERKLIAQHMLPTYLDPPADNSGYVVKPIYGSEGDSVTVMASDGRVISQSERTTFSDEPMVYQQHVAVPALELMTEFGPRKLHLITSCFLISGTPTGICVRAGEKITDASAWVLPICVGADSG
jgi:glutathionylspermidine synthase